MLFTKPSCVQVVQPARIDPPVAKKETWRLLWQTIKPVLYAILEKAKTMRRVDAKIYVLLIVCLVIIILITAIYVRCFRARRKVKIV